MFVFEKCCYNCRNGKTAKGRLQICKECGLPFQRKNWKGLFSAEEHETAIIIIKELLGHCRALKVLMHEDVPKLNENIKKAEDFLREVG